MNPFKRKGFDSIIGQNLVVKGDLTLCGTTIIDGEVYGGEITQTSSAVELIVAGVVVMERNIMIDNVTVTGSLSCDELIVKGTLAIKKDAIIRANIVKYVHLIIEPGAVVLAKLVHMNHDPAIPEGAVVLEFAK